MKLKVLFRVNAGGNSGIGHLVRCVNIALALSEYGVKSRFVLRFAEQKIVPFLQSFSYESLYISSPAEYDERQDAELFAQTVSLYKPDWIIVDDYRLGFHWEKSIAAEGAKVLAIDDIERRHHCDLLLEIRWRGSATDISYDQIVPRNCIKLLGPRFIPLADCYKQGKPVQKANSPFTLMLSLGGGGELSLFQGILEVLLSSKNLAANHLHVMVVIGPLAVDADELIQKYQSYPQVTFLIGKIELYSYLCQCDLYIGAAGGILYQLKALNIPAITFSLAANQDNPGKLFEDIGHYFHLGCLSNLDPRDLLSFVEVVVSNYTRVLALADSPRVVVDAQGAARVAKAIITYPEIEPEISLLSQSEQNQDIEILSSQYSIRPVVDTDINHYLESRNLAANRNNMISEAAIEKLQHYRWWFNTNRVSFLLANENRSCLYIWHQVKMINADKYLIGGWFVCHEDVGFQDSIIALNWQLKKCEQQYPGIPWIAVIHRDNKYVKLMNDYLGFTEIGINHRYFEVVSRLFEGADNNQFYFVVKESNH